MKEFFQHAMEYPTIIPFGLMIFMFMFFFVSLMFGFDKNIDHSIDHNIDSHDISHGGNGGGFLHFIGIKSGVHTMSLIFISFFFNFVITFFVSRYVDLDSTIIKKILGCAMIVCLFPILNNLFYVLLKPMSGWMSSGERDPISIIGKRGSVLKVFPDQKMLYISIEGFSEDQIVFYKDNEEIKEGDNVEIFEKEMDTGLNTVYYAKK